MRNKHILFCISHVALIILCIIYNITRAQAITWDDYVKSVQHGKEVQIEGISPGDSKNLTGRIYFPSEGTGPYPALVALHGAGGIFPYQLWWADWISQQGFIVLSIDSYCTRGHLCEHSSGDEDKNRGKIMRNWKKVSLKQRMFDAVAGYQYLSNNPLVKKDSIGLIGWSWGGTAALFTQKFSKRLSLPENGFKGTIAFYPNFKHVQNHRQWKGPGKIAQPTLILYGKSDSLESDGSYKKLKAAKHPGPLTVIGYKGAVRKFDELGPHRMKNHPSVGSFAKAFHKESFEKSMQDVGKFLTNNFGEM